MRLRRGFRDAWLALAALAADQLTKAWVRRGAGIRTLIPGIVRCRPANNAGMAFSMLSGHTGLLAGLTAITLAGLTAWLALNPDEPPLTRRGFWLVVGGGLGNLIDRLAFGAVTDFLELTFVRFAIFNVADVCVCVGAGLAALGILLPARRVRPARRGGEDGHGEV